MWRSKRIVSCQALQASLLLPALLVMHVQLPYIALLIASYIIDTSGKLLNSS